jgi:SAM-dependent methyltransferase
VLLAVRAHIAGMSVIHDAARHGFTAGAATYQAGRPDYPPPIVAWLKSALQLGAGSLALDLGAGTGKFLPFLKATGAGITALEPVPAMRERLAAANPDVPTLAGSAENIPLPDASLDAVVCAQSFHWFANGRALAEMRRVLKPGGALGLVWNVRNESASWVAALSRIVAPYEGTTPRYHDGKWRTLFPAPGFTTLQEQHFPYEHIGSPEQVILDRTLSISFIAALPAAEKAHVAAQVRTLIDSSPSLAGGQNVAFPYVTAAFHCRTCD